MLEALIYGLIFSLGFYLILFVTFAFGIVILLLYSKIRHKETIRSSINDLKPFLKALLLLHAFYFIPLILIKTSLYLNLYLVTLSLVTLVLVTGIFAVKWIANKVMV